MPDKVSEAQKSYLNEIQKVKSTAETWKSFLDFSANMRITDSQNQHEFATKMIIHAFNPNAMDCRSFDEWKTKDGNHVNYREKGIPILTRNSKGNQSVAYVFDSKQTALNPQREEPILSEASKERIKSSITNEVSRLADSSNFSEEQKRLFKEAAEYKLCKQYGLHTNDDSERFSGIDKLSEKEIAYIGLALNRCSQFVAEIVNNERSMSNERDNSKSGEDRSGLYRREQHRMDLGGGVQTAHEEVRVRREPESMVHNKQAERDIRAAVGNPEAEADSRNGQVRQSETEFHMADSLPAEDNAERGRGETLRGDERKGSEPDRPIHREETADGRVQGNNEFREIHSESTDVGELQSRSGGANTSDNGLRNISNDETAEPEKVSVVSSCYDLLKTEVTADDRINNAIKNSDRENVNIEIEKVLKEAVMKIFNEDIYGRIDFYADFMNAEKTDNRKEAENYIHNYVDEQIANKEFEITQSEPIKLSENEMNEASSIRTADDIEIGDRYLYKDREYTVASMNGVYPDDVGISYDEKMSNGRTYAVTSNVNKYELESNGVYLGKSSIKNIESTEKEKLEQPDKQRHTNTVEHRNFTKLQNMFPEIMSKVHIYERHIGDNLEPLALEWIGGNNLSVMQSYKQNGDLMCDPDIVLNVNFENETANAVSYENSGLGQYKEYQNGSLGQHSTNKFMSDWLDNIEQQEYKISRAIAEYHNCDLEITYKDEKIIKIDGDEQATKDFIKQYNIEINSNGKENIIAENPNILGTYAIYQLKDTEDTRDYRFLSSSEMEHFGLSVDKDNYEMVYSGELTADMSLDSIYTTFNMALPDDFIGHSLSMSDIIVLDTDNGMEAHYVDRAGYKNVPEFFAEKAIETDSPEINSEIQQPEDLEAEATEAVKEMNLKAIESIEVGDKISLNGKTFAVKSITDDFMMSMENVHHELGEESVRSFVGNWKSQLAEEAGNTPLIVNKAERTNEKNEQMSFFNAPTAPELTEQEKYFSKVDMFPLITNALLAHDEIESMSYPLFEPGYAERHKASEKAMYGNGLKETKLYDLANRMKQGEDIRKELAVGLLGNQSGNRFQFENQAVDFSIIHNENSITAVCGNAQREISYEEIGQKFLDNIENEYNDIAAYRAMENAFDRLRENHDFSEKQLQVINKVESVLGYGGYRDIDESLSDVFSTPHFQNIYGSVEHIDDLMDNRLNDIISEIKEYVSEEITKSVFVQTEPQSIEKNDSPAEHIEAVTDVNRFEELSREIIRGSNAENSKSRIAEFYKENNPSNKELAEFLQNEYGTGGHSADGKISFVDYDSKGLHFSLRSTGDDLSKETFDFTWNQVASLTADLIRHDKYITPENVKEISTSEKNISESAPDMSESEQSIEDKKPRFRITDEHIGEGTLKEKFRNNVEAIKTLQALEREERLPTEEEQQKLSKYIGWGGLQEAFDDRKPAWNAEYYELKNLLPQEEYEAARSTVNDAFYTSPIVTKAIYEALDKIGFKGGEVLEPSMGIGNFFGTMPDSMRDKSNLSGVEIDSISGRIAQKLYPEANIAINGYEKVKFNKNSFDLAIGNVPFGTVKINDKSKAYSNLLIHDYFFAKSIDNVRPGGIVAFVTSTGTLDKEDIKVRQMLAQKAELLGAIRLPGGKGGAFKDNAGTDVTTDIIFLKRREKNVQISDMAHDKSCDWVHTSVNKDGFRINNYFNENPDMILGTLDRGNFGATVCKAIPDKSLQEQLHEAVQNIKGEYTPIEFQAELNEQKKEDYLPATPDVENLTYTVVDNKLYYRVNDDLVPLKESEQHGAIAERRKGLCSLAETVRGLLQAQVENQPDDVIKALQTDLNTKYDRFVKKFDRINPIETPNQRNSSGVTRKSPNTTAFKHDVRLPLLQSLEKMRDGQFIGKTEIFTSRTIRPHKPVERVDTSHEALILSVSEKGRVDLDYMQSLTGFEKEKMVNDLKGDIFPVPELSGENNTVYQTSDEYLSGNIYKKISAAEEKLAENPEYEDNITALKEVIPTPLKATEIEMQLGMTWIDPKIIQQFMYETFDTPLSLRENPESKKFDSGAITVNFSEAGKGSWKINNARYDHSVKATKSFGTNDYNAYEILEKILNSKPVIVTDVEKDHTTGKTKTIVLEKETRAAEDRAKLIQNEFKKWIFKEPERRNQLVETYNHKFNAIRPRQYDGSSLNFIGSNPEINLKPHQKNAVAHALFGGNTLFAHEVGAGKTFEMIATAMEGKRLGLHNKSMFVVPNHLTEQIGSDFMKLYPNANILVAKPDDFSPQKRRQMCARIATGNFDAVIIGHSQLIKIPLSAKREQEFIQNQINEITESITATKNAGGANYTIKELEKAKAALKERFDKLVNSTVKDSTVTFEELGIDKMFVDEAHEFKNLFIATKMENVSGLATNPDTQKTQDLYMKCQYLDEKTNSKGVVFATGTPVTNALSEMFTMMKYLQTDLLKETGLSNFDSWAGNFTKRTNDLEIAPSGNEWRTKTRLKFTNVPELVTMFKECADIKMADQLNLDVPECKKEIVAVEPTEIQKKFVESLGERADRISMGAVSRTEDNMLLIVGDGRKLGLDQRLLDPKLPDEPQTKINACVNNVYNIWQKTAEAKSTQLVFCDLGVPQSKEDLKKSGQRFDVYADIKKKLLERGVTEKEIAFIHEADTEVKKAKLFAKVRSGEVRILIGSTQKMGAGTNVQDKLVALHDLDCPWRPADLTQRLGRMVRQGNSNDTVYNYRYVTKGTLDSYLYQTVEKKQDAFSRIFTSKDVPRTCDDIDDMTGELQDIKIAAIGDERMKQQAQLRKEISELKSMKNHYLEEKYELEDNIKYLPDKIAQAEKAIRNITEDTNKIKNFIPETDVDGKEKFIMKVGRTTYEDKKEAAEAFKRASLDSIVGNPNKFIDIAEYKGFKVAVSYDTFTKSMIASLKGANSYPFELGKSDTGNLTRIDNMINSVPKRIDGACNELQRLKTELADSITESKKPFLHEEELHQKEQELQKLVDEINADKLSGKIAPNQPENTVDGEKTPDNLNLKWKQNGKEILITYDSKADGDKVSLSVNNKITSHCKPESLEIGSAVGSYPPHITKGIPALNIAFSDNTALYVSKFIEKVKAANEKNKEKGAKQPALFSRDRIMSDEFKPTSDKKDENSAEHSIGG